MSNNHVSDLKEKYNLSDRDIILAYTVKRKQLEKTASHTVLKNSKLKNERTAKKLENMIIELKERNLSNIDLALELDKMSKAYNISSYKWNYFITMLLSLKKQMIYQKNYLKN